MAIKIQGTTVIDDSRNATNLGDITASGDINFTGSGSFKVPSGTTSQRPASPSVGEIRYNTDNAEFEQYDGSAWVGLAPPIEKGSLDKTFVNGESASISLSEPISGAPIVSVIKEVPQPGVTNNDWDVASDGANYTLHDTAYDTTLTPSNATGNGTFTLGTGSFASTDVGKRIVGNGGEAILTATDGSYELQTAFNDDSTIAAGDWSMFALDVESGDAGLTLSVTEIVDTVFDIENASYDNVSFDVSGQETAPRGITFNTNGTKMYVVGALSDSVHQYTLSTAFDLSTASYDNVSLDVSGQGTVPRDITFNTDGTKMYMVGSSSNSVHQYTLSTAFDLSTASYDNVSLDVSGQDGSPRGITLNTDGTKMYIVGGVSESVYQYTLSTAFDLSTASYDNVSFSVSGQDTKPEGIAFNTDGTKMYMVGNDNDFVYQYTLSTAFDLSTASYDNVSFSVSGQETAPEGIAFNTDGTKMYIVGGANESVYQYRTTTINNFIPTASNHTAITSASTDTEFWADINSMTADDASNDGSVYYAVSTDDRTTWSIIDDTNGVRAIARNNAGTWEVNDASDYGTETWVAASENDEFYALEEAVDVSTAPNVVGFGPADFWSYDSVNFNVSGQAASPDGITFNNDGTKMYICDSGSSNSVHQYTLSTAFDLSTASYDNVSLDVSGQDRFPYRSVFNDDGTKMYIAGNDNDFVYQYTLSTAFDLSTASYDNVSFSLSGQDTIPRGLEFNNDGTKMYVIGRQFDSVHQYTLSTAFDLSTASYDNVSFDVSSQDKAPEAVTFNNDGTKMYIAGNDNDFVYQYTLSTAFDLSTASYDNVSFDVSSQDAGPSGIAFNTDGTKIYLIGRSNLDVYQYTTASTISANRMDSTQLNAVSDANHYTLGDDLDLAITLFMADGNTNSPTSDGVSINYDANVLNQGAVLGTDYEFDKPANDKVRIKALSDENFKVRVV